MLRGYKGCRTRAPCGRVPQRNRYRSSGSHLRSLRGVYARSGQQTWPKREQFRARAGSVRLTNQMTLFPPSNLAHSGGNGDDAGPCLHGQRPLAPAQARVPPLLGALRRPREQRRRHDHGGAPECQEARRGSASSRIPAPPTPGPISSRRSRSSSSPPGRRAPSSGSRSSTTTCPAPHAPFTSACLTAIRSGSAALTTRC